MSYDTILHFPNTLVKIGNIPHEVCYNICATLWPARVDLCAQGLQELAFQPFPSYASVLKVAPIFTSFLLIFVRKISKNTS